MFIYLLCTDVVASAGFDPFRLACLLQRAVQESLEQLVTRVNRMLKPVRILRNHCDERSDEWNMDANGKYLMDPIYISVSYVIKMYQNSI